MVTRTKYPIYMGFFRTKKEVTKRAKFRQRHGYAVLIKPVVYKVEGRTIRGYQLYESQRPVRHTWWAEHLFGETPKEYLSRMERRGIKAYTR